MSTAEKPKAGLEDTVATSSAICYLDGDRGVLAYCGYDIHDLARQATFEEVCYLLWHRRLPTRAELGDLQSELSAARSLPDGVLRYTRSDVTRLEEQASSLLKDVHACHVLPPLVRLRPYYLCVRAPTLPPALLMVKSNDLRPDCMPENTSSLVVRCSDGRDLSTFSAATAR